MHVENPKKDPSKKHIQSDPCQEFTGRKRRDSGQEFTGSVIQETPRFWPGIHGIRHPGNAEILARNPGGFLLKTRWICTQDRVDGKPTMQIQFALIMAFGTMISSGSGVQTISETLGVLQARISAVDDANFVDAADKASLLSLVNAVKSAVDAVDDGFESVTLEEFRLLNGVMLTETGQIALINLQLLRVRSGNRNFWLQLARASYNHNINAFVRFTLFSFVNTSLRAAQRLKTAGTTEATAANTVLFDTVDLMRDVWTASSTLITSETPDLQGTANTVGAKNAEIATKITELKTAINAIG
ncbi:unnamed protein product [Cyprideis torosa]|uniref:Uncharacterized protein n=1 Tax=Cyprideis torosa TaxID=163714 RepID=A0A7R8ZVF7_9CRUS|nr:unnamed protein product [Cyprideis torosa]CAG0902609.1 unnamed protein product [Cyprideis torosa]